MKIEINYRENIILEIYLNCYKNSMIIDLYDFFCKIFGISLGTHCITKYMLFLLINLKYANDDTVDYNIEFIL